MRACVRVRVCACVCVCACVRVCLRPLNHVGGREGGALSRIARTLAACVATCLYLSLALSLLVTHRLCDSLTASVWHALSMCAIPHRLCVPGAVDVCPSLSSVCHSPSVCVSPTVCAWHAHAMCAIPHRLCSSCQRNSGRVGGKPRAGVWVGGKQWSLFRIARAALRQALPQCATHLFCAPLAVHFRRFHLCGRPCVSLAACVCVCFAHPVCVTRAVYFCYSLSVAHRLCAPRACSTRGR